MEVVDLYGSMLIFALGSTVGTIFTFFILEETSGKCLDEIGNHNEIEAEKN